MPTETSPPPEPRISALRSSFVRNIAEPCLRYFSADTPFNFAWVKNRELLEVNASRAYRERYQVNNDLTGLACSGGGIRSATFNLGIIQGLAERGWLRQIDYISTISGGGYVGSWLVAWIRRVGSKAVEERLGENRQPAPENEPERYLEPDQVRFLRKYSNYLTPWMGLFGADTWTAFAIYLRNLVLNLVVLIAFGCCMLLVADIALWMLQARLIATPIVLTSAAAVFLVFVMLCTGMGFGALSTESRARHDWRRLIIGHAGACVSWGILLAAICGTLLFGYWRVQLKTVPLERWILWGGVIYFILWMVAVAGLLWCLKGGNADPIEQRRWFRWTLLAAMTLLIGALEGFLLYEIGALFAWLNPQGTDLVPLYAGRVALIVFGPPLLMASTMVAAVFHMGLSGRSMPDSQREWLARAGGITFLLALFWVAGFSAAFYGPLLVKFLVSSQWAKEEWGRFFKWVIGFGWLSTTAAGLLAGRSPVTNGANKKFSILTRIAPPVFVIGLVLLLSFGLDMMLSCLPTLARQPSSVVEGQKRVPAEEVAARVKANTDALLTASSLKAQSKAVEEIGKDSATQNASFDNIASEHWTHLGAYSSCVPGSSLWRCVSSSWIWKLLVFGLVVVWVFGNRVDINEFSMHLFYRNRLTRAYLGASVTGREPDPFTGFSAEDDLQLRELAVSSLQPRQPLDPQPEQDSNKGMVGLPYDGPYPIFGAALNLVRGKELAWQNRKASSFVFTPLFCGYDYYGDRSRPPKGKYLGAAYRPTKDYTRKDGPRLGTAVAISGAAASPNMGYHTNPALAFLMTVFNVRLGAWFANPRHSTLWRRRTGPALGLLYLLCELFPRTSDEMHYVYLSDGGHFENLGIYELVRRRCRYIISGDGSCDEKMTFQDLGNAIDKCRRDFGVDISIRLEKLVLNDKLRTAAHFALGTIQYRNPDEVGYLLYLKPSLVGDEPSDVVAYCNQHPHFPHDTTGDQFFSESQFESYRALGQHIFRIMVDLVTEKPAGHDPILPASLQDLFKKLWALTQRTTSPWTDVAQPLDQHLRISYR